MYISMAWEQRPHGCALNRLLTAGFRRIFAASVCPSLTLLRSSKRWSSEVVDVERAGVDWDLSVAL